MRRLAEATCPEGEPLVIEIGPGRGALTSCLLERAQRVIAIEIDAALAALLRNRYPAERLTVIEADVLETDLRQWGPVALAGNLPYYITAPILEKIFRLGGLLKRAVVLLQKEVAERVTAGPGSRDYGYLSVETRFFTLPEMLFPVSARAFVPPPRVDSAAVRLTPRSEALRWPEPDRGRFLEFASRCFRQKRKTLRNNLRGFYEASLLEDLPEAGRRAEQLSLEELLSLYGRLARPGGIIRPSLY